MDAYAGTVGATRAYIEGENGQQAGDPARAVAAIASALDAGDAPLRLALGADAVDAIRAKHQTLRSELERWEATARATAYQD